MSVDGSWLLVMSEVRVLVEGMSEEKPPLPRVAELC
mgnify:CR=1 FL=1